MKPKYKYTGPTNHPVLHCSICTGEQVAGFKDENGHFTEVMLINDKSDLDEFMKTYKISSITKEY